MAHMGGKGGSSLWPTWVVKGVLVCGHMGGKGGSSLWPTEQSKHSLHFVAVECKGSKLAEKK